MKIDELFTAAINEATKERGHINILIAGRSGYGKSTLINSVFHANIAETGQGKPVTTNTREVTKDGVPLSIFDTRGLEMSDFDETINSLESFIKSRCADPDPNKHIHLAWLCIQEDSRRVENAEIDLHNMLSHHVPMLSVITKARSDGGFRQEVQKLLPRSKNVLRVRAISETMDDGHVIKAYGLEELISASSELIPEGVQRAFSAAQKASIANKTQQAHKVVLASAAASLAAGASPIPMSDAAILAAIQVSMLAKITSVFGVELSKGTLATLVSSTIGVTGSVFVGRAIVANLLKLFPGVGTVAGGLISGATASTLTVALGEAYIAVLASMFSKDPDAIPNIDDIAEQLKQRIRA